jgi:hypothetical protein
MLPEVYTDTVACICYNVDGKCKGMLTPERLNILRKAFHRAKGKGYTAIWGAMYEHLRVVPPGKRLRVPSCTRPEILGSG